VAPVFLLSVFHRTEWRVKIATYRTEMTKSTCNQPKISLFGHFGAGNFGNESTLQAMLCNLRRLIPDAEVTCICTTPETVAADYKIESVPMSGVVVKPWTLRNPLARLMRKLFIGMPSEPYRWLEALMTLKGTNLFIIPGTGLLTDAYGLRPWGPYTTFKWSLMAKMRGCKLLFVSVGAGPIYGRLGRLLVRSTLALADFRSYRDADSVRYLKNIGFVRTNDRIYPDLAFSLPQTLISNNGKKNRRRSVVGLGLMQYAGKYSVPNPTDTVFRNYLENMVILVTWLLAHDYDVRLLIGDVCDRPVTEEFNRLLKERSGTYDASRIIDEPIDSVEQLLSQLSRTDFVVATRFHNVLLALLSNKPTVAISFHHKCSSLMSAMGLSEYCLDINDLKGDKLIEQFYQLEKNAGALRVMISEKAEGYREALDDQYNLILQTLDVVQ
jgi:polysaccharide pyruvyl transferase WcaK-like protein